MAGKYKYLTFEDRQKIEAWHARGDRPVEIAARLGVHTATIYNELKRGYTGMTPYKILTLFRIHKEFNPDRFKQEQKEADIDDVFMGL